MSPKIFNGYVDQAEKIPQFVQVRCGLLPINDSLKIIGECYKLQSCLLKQELEQDESYEYTWEIKKMSGYLILKTMFYQLLFLC